MLRSLNSGVTGLINHQVRMDVIGNNISNVNSEGFKRGRVGFSESFSQMVKGASKTQSKAGGTNPMQIGLGVKVGSVDTIITQGALTNTNRVFDLAIEGNAFFGVSDGVGTYYTRNGAFQLDAEGYIILPTNGMVLQGKMADSYGNFPPGTAIGNLKIPMTQQAPAKETTFVELGKNLPMDGDAKGNVIYSDRFLHVADGYRDYEGNGLGDPGRTITTLTSLFTNTGKSLNIKDGDILTFSWTDQPSKEANDTIKYEVTFVVNDPSKEVPPRLDWSSGFWDEGTQTIRDVNDQTTDWIGAGQGPGRNVNYVWSLEDIKNALNQIMSGTAVGTPPTLVPVTANGVSTTYAGAGLTVDLEDGALVMRADGGNEPTAHVFTPTLQTSNPLSGSNVPFALSFPGYAGPGMPPTYNFGTMTDPGSTKADPNEPTWPITNPNDPNYVAPTYSYADSQLKTINLMRPAEQFDVLGELLTSNGSKLGLDDGDPIDLAATIGKLQISNSQSAPLIFQSATRLPDGSLDPNAPAPTLLDAYIAKIRNDLRLPPDYVDRDGKSYSSVSVNGMDGDPNMPFGAIVVRSMKGKDFEINRLTTSADNSNRDATAPRNFVQNAGFKPLRGAEDVGQFAQEVEVYDSSGAPHTLTITFVHTGRAGEWEWHASFTGKEVILPGTGTGKLYFGQDGTVSSFTFDDGGSQLIVDPCNGAQEMRLDLNVGGPGDFRGLTQYDSECTYVIKAQDGYGTGGLVEVSIDEFGLIEGAFSNGQVRAIGQIMVVDFANPGGLLDLSDSIFTRSANSGDPVWGKPNSQSSSKLRPGALEMSNVDLGTEFTTMITTQRGYQANSRIVTVSDSMLEELVNLKR